MMDIGRAQGSGRCGVWQARWFEIFGVLLLRWLEDLDMRMSSGRALVLVWTPRYARSGHALTSNTGPRCSFLGGCSTYMRSGAEKARSEDVLESSLALSASAPAVVERKSPRKRCTSQHVSVAPIGRDYRRRNASPVRLQVAFFENLCL